jgi:hypothetical protein
LQQAIPIYKLDCSFRIWYFIYFLIGILL